MKKSKSTKRALTTSIISMVLCLAMFVGTTFAWFTDTASTKVNSIQAGKLDVELEKSIDGGKTWTALGGEPLKFLQTNSDSTITETEDILWEPGATYELPQIRISNQGNLALKYKIVISGIEGNAELNNVIEWTIENDGTGSTADISTADISTAEYNLNAKSGETIDSDILKISGHMKEDAGNQYQGKTITGISITVIATQLNSEFDSISNDYDKDAIYPVYTVADVTTKAGQNNTTLVNTSVDIKTTETVSIDGSDKPVASANIPENVVLEDGTTQLNLIIKESEDKNNIAINTDQDKKTLEI